MDKLSIAEELKMNSTNIYIKHFLDDYTYLLQLDKPFIEEDYIRLDNCIEYISKSEFDIKGWLLWEIPIFYSHCFLYKDYSKAFDLAVWDIGEVIPRYLDDSACEQDAKSISEAIEKYDMYDYQISKSE